MDAFGLRKPLPKQRRYHTLGMDASGSRALWGWIKTNIGVILVLPRAWMLRNWDEMCWPES